MKYIDKFKSKNKCFRIYKINSSEVHLLKKVHLKIIEDTPKIFDSPYNYNLFKEDIKNKKEHLFLIYYENKIVAYCRLNIPDFRSVNNKNRNTIKIYKKRYDLKKNEF
jgi:predicted GNAT family N-acyltransferase